MRGETIQVDGQEIRLSNLRKVLFPESGITKGDLVTYYRGVAKTMLPLVRGRPVTMQRFPDGIGAEGFYAKDRPEYFPSWIASVELPKKEGGSVDYVLAQNTATLVYLADQAVITLHVALSRRDIPGKPDRLIFDLDPPEGVAEGFELVKHGAWELRSLLQGIGLVPHVMTTGSRGLHVTVPLERRQDFDTVRRFARDVAELLVHREPDRFTIEQRKAKRGRRLYLDVMRNAYGQTGVAPYSVRARPGAPVATPLDWDELERSDLGPHSYTIHNILQRVGERGDPWGRISAAAKPLGAARDRLATMRS
jgi:bifunctional non-homologous end joining protein LigD